MVVTGCFDPLRGKFSGEKARVFENLEDVFRLPALIFAIDLPLGLPEKFSPGGRECDRLARKLLGPRRASIFTPPPREALSSISYQELRERGIKISRQSFNLLLRIREFQRIWKPALAEKVFETHPELLFKLLSGEDLPSKHRLEGMQKRLELLKKTGLLTDLETHWKNFPATLKKDLLDAYACLLVAKRIFKGEARVLPESPPKDLRGIPLAIWF